MNRNIHRPYTIPVSIVYEARTIEATAEYVPAEPGSMHGHWDFEEVWYPETGEAVSDEVLAEIRPRLEEEVTLESGHMLIGQEDAYWERHGGHARL